MREWLMAGGAIPNEPQLRKDLCVLEADTDKTDRWLLESKESLRMRNEDSPDDGDALALTFTAPVVKAEVMGLRNRAQAFATDWSPTEGVPETPARMNVSHEDPWGYKR